MRKPHHRAPARCESLESRRLMAGVTMSLSLVDANGAAIAPTSSGTWSIKQGTTFRVVASALVTSPNKTHSARSVSALRNQPLGVENLAVDILSSASKVADPVAQAAQPVPQWSGYDDLTPHAFGYPWVNLLDSGKDGDLDVMGAGMVNTTFTLGTTTALPRFQYGATGSPTQIFSGLYRANTNGTTKLSTKVVSANVYADSNADAAITAVSVLASAVNGSITINVGGGVVTPTGGSISGKAFKDADKDGVYDSGEAGLGGATLFLDKDKDGVKDLGEPTAT
ncbi:MAG TPA: hypothetical protein VER17_01765, partial [Tepidisphaeraceae bacterium]|nr:hypothetical protein [Tepidisphaeraceae bacterium]